MNNDKKRLPHGVHFSLCEEDATLFFDFMKREGFSSISTAARALVLMGIENWPLIGLARATRQGVAIEARRRIVLEITNLFKKLERELLDETHEDRAQQVQSELANAVVNLEVERGTR